MTGVESFPFIDRGGMFWDRGDDFSKINDQGSHRVKSHQST